MALVPLSRLEWATSANADLDTRGPTVNLVMPHLTFFHLYITFHDRYGCKHDCLFVRTYISGFRYNRWVGYEPSTYSQTCMTSIGFVFSCSFFLSSVLASAYLLAFRIEVFFLIERLPWKATSLNYQKQARWNAPVTRPAVPLFFGSSTSMHLNCWNLARQCLLIRSSLWYPGLRRTYIWYTNRSSPRC